MYCAHPLHVAFLDKTNHETNYEVCTKKKFGQMQKNQKIDSVKKMDNSHHDNLKENSTFSKIASV